MSSPPGGGGKSGNGNGLSLTAKGKFEEDEGSSNQPSKRFPQDSSDILLIQNLWKL